MMFERHTFAGELDRMRMAQLVRREATATPARDGAQAQRLARGAGRPGAPAGAAVKDAEQRADRHLAASVKPWLDVLEAPDVHADLAPAAALAAAHEHRSAPRVEIEFGQRQRFLDAQPGAPQDDDQRAHPVAMETLAGLAHHGDDLFRPGRVGQVALTLVAWDAAEVVAGHARGSVCVDRVGASSASLGASDRRQKWPSI